MKYESEDYWEARRAAHVRARRRAAWRELVSAVMYAVLAFAAIAGLVLAVRTFAMRGRDARAAEIEGRWGLDKGDALAMAAAEKWNEELGMRNEEWRTDSSCASLSAGGSVIRPYRVEVK